MFGRLPDCDDLFRRFFDPWYSAEDRERRIFPATRPDVMQIEKLVGITECVASALPANTCEEVSHQIDRMLEAARGDWPDYLGVAGEIDLSWVEAFDRYWNRKKIRDLIRGSDPEDFGNEYVILCCEFGAVLGHVMRQFQPRLIWCLEWPYWESSLVDPKKGIIIPVFHWSIKKMSRYGVDDGFAEKVQACLRMLDEDDSQRSNAPLNKS